MKKKILMVTLVAAVSLVAGAAFADSVGKCTVTGKSGASPDVMYISIKGNKTRTEIVTPKETAINIIDSAKGEMTVLLPAQKMYMKHSYEPTKDKVEFKPGSKFAAMPDGSKLDCTWTEKSIEESMFTVPPDYKKFGM